MSTPRRSGIPPLRADPTRTARLQRDAGVERGRTITKGIAFGSVAAVAVAGVYLSQALPGHDASTSSTTSGASISAPSTGASIPAVGTSGPVGSSSTDGSVASSQSSGISPSASAPVPAYRQAPVVSGSS